MNKQNLLRKKKKRPTTIHTKWYFTRSYIETEKRKINRKNHVYLLSFFFGFCYSLFFISFFIWRASFKCTNENHIYEIVIIPATFYKLLLFIWDRGESRDDTHGPELMVFFTHTVLGTITATTKIRCEAGEKEGLGADIVEFTAIRVDTSINICIWDCHWIELPYWFHSILWFAYPIFSDLKAWNWLISIAKKNRIV